MMSDSSQLPDPFGRSSKSLGDAQSAVHEEYELLFFFVMRS